jgi:putative acetyltransferase
LDQWAWVAKDGERMTGVMSLRRDGELDMAFVIPEVRGNGTASALYETLLEKARSEGFERLTVHAAEQSKRFLGRRGWTVDRMANLKDAGHSVDLAIMSLPLKS